MPFVTKAARLGFFVIFLSQMMGRAECETGTPGQQRTFCGEAPTGNPRAIVPGSLPTDVLSAVMRSKIGKEVSAQAAEDHEKLDPGQLLRGTPIPLADTGDRFYLLVGDYPLSGSDNIWFWLVSQSGHRASVLLFLQGNCVHIEPRKTKGYADVRAEWGAGMNSRTEIYKYDGKRYRLWHSRWLRHRD